jgi:hypothetical protein
MSGVKTHKNKPAWQLLRREKRDECCIRGKKSTVTLFYRSYGFAGDESISRATLAKLD